MFVMLPTPRQDFWVNVDRVVCFRASVDPETGQTSLWMDDGTAEGWQMAVALPPEEVALRLQGLVPVA